MLYCQVCICTLRTVEPCFTFLLGLIKNGEIVGTALIVGLVLNQNASVILNVDKLTDNMNICVTCNSHRVKNVLGHGAS